MPDAADTGDAADVAHAGPPAEPTVNAYLDALASDAPAPGGGSATGLAGAMAAALVSMVASFTVGRPRYAAVEAQVKRALDEAEEIRRRLAQLMVDDEAAYDAVAAARALPRKTDAERAARRAAIERATRTAAAPPLAMAAACRRALDLSQTVAELGNRYLASDAGVAALLAEAALRASAINVRVNLAALEDKEFARSVEQRLNALLEGTPALKERILAIAGQRMVGG
jgi:formiminotetrahydrofolate cyclodeaminase